MPRPAPAARASESLPSAAVSAPPEAPSIDIPEIDALVARALAEQRMPGAVVVVGRRSGVLMYKAYGQRALIPEPLPMRPDTIFDLASLTKPIVTGTLVQRLVDDGKLRLDEPVAQHLSAFEADGKEKITVRQLLLHTSGLPIENPLRDYADGPALALERVLAQKPEATPGQSYTYGDVGYIVLGALIERVAGEPLDALARRHIFEPLRMRDSGYRPPATERFRIAPTELAEERAIPLIHGDVHDPRAYLLGGVAGNAGLFATASDVARYARMLLGEGELDGVRVLSRLGVQELTRPHRVPGAVRTPGWDMASSYSKPKGRYLSARAFGHGGYTGTSLWVDPLLDLFVSFSSNRVHPNGDGNVIALEADITDAAVRALAPVPAACAPGAIVQTGIDALRERGFDSVRGRRVALVTNRAAIARDGVSTLDVLARAPEVDLVAVLSPEHGLEASGEGRIADSREAAHALPVYSLYGETLRPTARMLQGVDVIVVDLVDVGTRYYTYMSTLHQTLLSARQFNLPVVVLDRPNPIGGLEVDGPMLDIGYENFVNHHRLPVRHGMTAGEIAELINDERAIGARIEVVEARGWQRGQLYPDTGLPWVPPSPNLRDIEATLLYPAIGLVESTNVSVGRGTDRPFHIIGAPYIDGAALLRDLRKSALPGVRFEAIDFVPEAAPHAGKTCHGVAATITDTRAFRPVRTGLAIARSLWRRNASEWHSQKLMRLVGNREVIRALFAGASLDELERRWQSELDAFRDRRAQFLRYPDCSRYPPAVEVSGALGRRAPVQ